MTEIEKKALALIAELKAERGLSGPDYLSARAALIRAIEQHEAFRQEVSDALVEEWGEEYCLEHRRFSGFIIAKPASPLLQARKICADIEGENKAYQYLDGSRDDYPMMRAVLAALKAKIAWEDK